MERLVELPRGMKILQVIHSLDPRAGGTTEGLRQLSTALAQEGVGVQVLCLDPPDSPWLRAFPFPVVALGPGGGGYGYSPQVVPWLVEHADEYDWIIFTSVNAIAAFVAELPDSDKWFRPRIATIGPATREVAEEYGFRVEVTPEKYVAESLAEAFRAHPLDGKRILIPSAAVARDVVPNELRSRGAEVDVVQAYQNVIPYEAPAQAGMIFQEPLPDWVTFASSSAVDHLVALVEIEVLKEVKIASIGPATSATVLKHGLSVTSEALKHTIAGLIEGMRNY